MKRVQRRVNDAKIKLLESKSAREREGGGLKEEGEGILKRQTMELDNWVIKACCSFLNLLADSTIDCCKT
jgi:hypothetical protein